ncbi:MAG: carbon-nitrogen hydrolase family protein [Desulfurococcales archaeon]|nr:carbon-nitrogen hydrolase family protein [Desulfurococcales archaeon]
MARGNVRIGVLHLRLRLGSKRVNLRRLQSSVEALMRRHREGVDVLVLPQHPLTGPIIGYYHPERVQSHLRSAAERFQSTWGGVGFTISTLSKIAADYGVAIIGGPIVERAGPRLYLSTIYIDSSGEVGGRYRKITLSREEKMHALGHGREVAVFDVGGRLRIGVFADLDLLNPEIFRGLQLSGANLLVGSLLPQRGGPLPVEEAEEGYLKPRREAIRALVFSRALETGLPLILVGGIVESANGAFIEACSETLVVDPEAGVLEPYTRTIDDPDSHIIIEVNPGESKPRICDNSCVTALKALCRLRRSPQDSERSSREETARSMVGRKG